VHKIRGAQGKNQREGWAQKAGHSRSPADC